MTRLGQTLMHISDLTWIVIEDDHKVTDKLKKIMAKFSTLQIVLMAGETGFHVIINVILMYSSSNATGL